MLIKQADDKGKRLKLLEDLQASPALDASQKSWLKDEYWRVKRGIEGERDAAFHIDSLLRDSKNHAVLHDLKIAVDGHEAQIDHLIVGRMMDFILVETKCYAGDVQINAQGEFTVQYGSGKRFGIASPIAQSERHERVLVRLLERLEITGRLGLALRFHHLVMLHPKAIIERPDPKLYDTSHVIKADQFAQWRERWIGESSKLSSLHTLLNLRGQDTLRDWAEKIARQHRSDDPLRLPDFMQPRVQPARAPSEPPPARPAPAPAPAPLAARAVAAPATAAAGAMLAPAPAPEPAGPAPEKRLVCASCGAKISYAEGRFCWNNAQRFGGLQYCRLHQADLA